MLYENELMRGRLWVALTGALAVGGLVSALLLDAPGAQARILLALGCLLILATSLVGLAVLVRQRARYSSALAAAYSYICLVGALPAFHFFGWFSPVTVLVALGAVIYAMGHTTRAVVMLAVSVVASHSAVAGLAIAGVTPDRGIAMPRVESSTSAVFLLAICQSLFLVSFVVGRQLRGHALVGIRKYGDVIRENTRRETLLQEAAEELRRVRNVGGPGRYTGVCLGTFELGIVLGRGGMGEVYDARDVATDEPAAVKVITPTSGTDQRAISRFEREIELAASIRSPYIVRVLGHSAPADAIMYLAMERLEGASLADELRARRAPSTRYVLSMLRQVARGTADAHLAGVVHRDLTPHNIFHHVGEGDDVWKILDFGVSKLVGGQGTLTGAGVVGTPAYMSPEQVAGRDIDERTDLFALGCIAYRCLTGHTAFGGGGMADVLYRVVHEMPARPSALVPLPQEVDLVLAVALAKDRRDRL